MSAIYKNGVQYVGITDAANMSVDVGQNTLNLKDTVQNVIENFADTETNPSSGNHSIGDFFTYNGILYKVIDDIEQGDTLIVGTNIIQTSFGKQLEEADSNSFIYAETIEQLYEQINNIPMHQVRLFEINNELASILTNGTITTFFKGYVANMEAEQHIFDLFGLDGNGYLYGQRIRFDSSTTFTIQRKESFPRVERTYIKRQQITTQLNSSENRLITQNFIMEDNVTDYDIIQLIATKTGFFCFAKSRESGNYTRLWDTNLMPILGMGGTEITSNQNLNNFKTPGNYFCKFNATVATLSNCPTTEAFKMFISYPTGGSTDFVGQEIKEFSHNKIYYRWYNVSDATWRSWEILAPVSGGASSIWTNNLAPSMALVSSTSGKVASHATVSATELGYLNGVTSAIQTQINGKAPTSHASSATTYGVASTANYGHVKYGTSSGTACQGNDSRLSNSRTPVAHASTATTYGIGTGSNYGHVKLSDTYASTVANNAAANGMGASQKALYNTYNSLLNTYMKYSSGTGTVNTTYVNTGEKKVFDWQRIRIGNKAIVTLVFDFFWRSTYSTNDVAIAATGLPGAAAGGYAFAAASASTDSNNENKTFMITTDGVLKPWYCGNITGHCFGSVTYISSTAT